MARFILDVANIGDTKELQEKVIDFLSSEIATIQCIDESNHNQFHNDEKLNVLSEEQINSFNNNKV